MPPKLVLVMFFKKSAFFMLILPVILFYHKTRIVVKVAHCLIEKVTQIKADYYADVG
jgi:hypothetical protein